MLDQERLCSRIVEEAQDAILFSDREGLIRLWNVGAERIFGFRAEEALGQSLDIIIPEPLRQRHWSGYWQVMETGTTRYASDLLAVPALRKDGSRISIEFTVIPIKADEGHLIGVAAIVRDVTARREEDNKLRQRLAELEKRPPL